MYDRSDTASPTVAKDALMLSILIYSHEGRDVGTADVVGAYLKAYMDDYILVKFEVHGSISGHTMRNECRA